MNKLILASMLLCANTSLAQTTDPTPYCSAYFDDSQGFPVDDHINSVSFGTLNNITNSQFIAPHYVFYNNLSPAYFIIGNTYTLKINFATSGGCGYGVWIDYNLNNIFEASEKIAGTTGTNMLTVGDTSTITQAITIPVHASLGVTRMRVRIVEDDNYNMTSTDELPCNLSTSETDVMDWGETEDYLIHIIGLTNLSAIDSKIDFSIAPNPSKGLFTLTTHSLTSTHLEVYSILGNLIHQQAITNSQTQLDLSQQPKGVYFARVSDSNKTVTIQKIVIE